MEPKDPTPIRMVLICIRATYKSNNKADYIHVKHGTCVVQSIYIYTHITMKMSNTNQNILMTAILPVACQFVATKGLEANENFLLSKRERDYNGNPQDGESREYNRNLIGI